jgi:hypothetical protein
VMTHDFRAVELRASSGQNTALRWYGGALWRATVAAGTYTACAIDAAGNEACSKAITVE